MKGFLEKIQNKIRAFFYVLKLSLENLLKNWYMLLASVFVLFTGLYIMGCLGLVSSNIRNILAVQAEHPEVEIICRQSVSDEASLSIYQVILYDSRIDDCVRNTKADNFEKLKKTLKGYENLFEYEDENSEFLYVSFDVRLKSASDLEGFSEDMRKVTGVEEVQNNDSVYRYFTDIGKGVRTGTLVALVVLGLLSLLMMVNTIKLTVLARRRELRIMRDLGASYAFMQGPFIVEGIVIGLIGAIAAFFAVKGTYSYLVRLLERTESSLSSVIVLRPFSDYSGRLLLIFIGSSVLIGLVASLFAIRNYIDNEKDDDK